MQYDKRVSFLKSSKPQYFLKALKRLWLIGCLGFFAACNGCISPAYQLLGTELSKRQHNPSVIEHTKKLVTEELLLRGYVLKTPDELYISATTDLIDCTEYLHAKTGRKIKCSGITFVHEQPDGYREADVFYRYDPCVGNTSLAHELIHAFYDDTNHSDPELWECPGGRNFWCVENPQSVEATVKRMTACR